MNDDKKKILILKIVIAFLVLLIGVFLVYAVIDLSKPNDIKMLETTTRRTYSTTSSEPTSIIPASPDITTDKNEPTSNNPESETGNNKTTTTNGNGTPKASTTTRTISSSSIIPPESGGGSSVWPIPTPSNYQAATGKSKNANALDDWEWEIVRRINAKRVQNGLNELIVAEELRTKAETAALKYNTEDDEAVRAYLDGYNNYRLKSNYPKEITIDKLYTNTVSSISIETNKYIKYVGVGVIYLEKSWLGQPTYYYCIIYE